MDNTKGQTAMWAHARPDFGDSYHEFQPNKYEGRYWNSNGYGCAIVASVGVEGEWSAYIGGCDPQSEEDGLDFVLRHGAKLSEKDARHFFPAIHLPYRP